jgi:hypothetical protein
MKRNDTSDTIRYEIPELSHRHGASIFASTLPDAQRIALEHGCNAVWQFEWCMEIRQRRDGSCYFSPGERLACIHAYQGGRWQVVEDTGRCTCGGCTAH